ncbi:MAG TPA: hypothetical protein PKD85_01265, partial [Saprospiraceae bacterium]|nr:hypothetical protein [Saprospiraceae bacterium]
RNILHLETLFIIGIIIFFIYIVWFAKDKNVENLSNLIKYKNSVKKRPKSPKKNKSEERCREIFENIFQSKFKSVRPDWLKNPVTNKNLELDGYCPHIKTPLGQGLAFEYDGVQHSQYNKHFHRGGPQEFVYQTKKDSWKDLTCEQNGVLLIRIPHFVAFQDLERYIRRKLERKGMGTF